MAKRLIFLFLILFSCTSEAVKKKKKPPNLRPPLQTCLVADLGKGVILHSENASQRIYPASLTKVMTLYLTFDAINSGKLSMNDKLRVSRAAEKMKPSKLGLKSGEYISVYHAVMGLIVRSANDAAVTLAENIAGSEESFVRKMNAKAKELGMADTSFRNASGWHHDGQKTTAVDLAKLAISIKNYHNKFYYLFSATEFYFKGQKITGHNKVLATYPWADGLKTGYTSPSGYNLITTAAKDGKEIVAVVTGRPSASIRDSKMVELLDRHLGIKRVYSKKSNKNNKKPLKVVSKNRAKLNT